MSKITLSQIADLTQSTTAQTTINSNSNTVQTAFDNTLSRDGTSPNQMGSNLDMNSNQILNLPSPATVNSPARLIDVVTNPTILVPPVGTSGAVVPLLNANNIWSGTDTFNGNVTLNGGANQVNGATTFQSGGALQIAGGSSGSVTFATVGAASGTVTVPNGPATLLSTAGHISTGTATNPASTTSLSPTVVMMGLGSSFTFTPLYSTRALLILTGQLLNGTGGDGALAQLRFGTGTAPVNGAAATGTQVGQLQAIQTVTANTTYPTTLIGPASGLTPGTVYWIDAALAAISGGTASIVNCGFTVVEI